MCTSNRQIFAFRITITYQWDISPNCHWGNIPCPVQASETEILNSLHLYKGQHPRFPCQVIELCLLFWWSSISETRCKCKSVVPFTPTNFTLYSHSVTLDWIFWWWEIVHVMWIFSSQTSWLRQTLPSSLSLFTFSVMNAHKNNIWRRSSDSTHGEMPIITVHLLSIPTQSEVIQKALSELMSCTLESPSSFFCWLQLSVAVWAWSRLITVPVS